MKKILEFLRGSVEELRQVSWPDKDTIVVATVSVFVFTSLLSVVLFGIDVLVRKGLQGLMS